MIRKYENFDLTKIYDEYSKREVNIQALVDKMFLTNGRLFHHERMLTWFPSYLELFTETITTIMNSDDVLPITWKYYISIMAVSCYDCEYLLKI